MPEINKIDYSGLPISVQESMKEYIERGRPVGSFLNAVLSNDLKEAVTTADDVNIHCMKDYVVFLYNQAPRVCYGSVQKVDKWLNQGGFNGAI